MYFKMHCLKEVGNNTIWVLRREQNCICSSNRYNSEMRWDSHRTIPNIFFFFIMDFILEENAHGLALKFSQNQGNLENYKHGTVK